MLYPPRPANISIPAVVAGNILQNDDTSISAIDSGYDGTVVVRTQNKIAMIINPDQKTSINTDETESMLTVNNNSSMTSTIRLSYQDSFYFDGRITSNGNVLFEPSCDDQFLNPELATAFKKNFDIADHDGMRMGLRLGGKLITASATELNYVDVPIGVARPNKALVLDDSLNINGINKLNAQELTGTLQTGNQPNITSLKTVNITDDLYIKGDRFALTPQIMNYLQLPSEGTAFASKAVVLDHNKNYSGINNLVANSITGTLTSGPQPNITSLSALLSLTNNGRTTLNDVTTIKSGNGDQLVLKFSDTLFSSVGTNATGDMVLKAQNNKVIIANLHSFQIAGHNGSTTGLTLGNELVLATGSELNYTKVSPGTASASKAVVLDSSKNVSGINQLNASVITGTMNTANQPNITSVNTLNIANHNGTIGLSLNGTLITATATQLNATNVLPGLAASGRALILDNSKNITGINSLSSATLGGVITTAIQPNITQVNTLTILNHNGTTGLTLGSTLITATGTQINKLNVEDGVAENSKVLVLDGSKNIVGINSLGANFLSGVLQTPNQPNIRQVELLNISGHNGSNAGLSLNGKLVTADADQLNSVDIAPGTADRNKALVLNSSLSISGINVLNANSLGGVLTSSTQPNIRNLTSINVVDHDGTTGLSLGGILVKSNANQLNYLDVQQGNGAASKALVLDSSRNITNINTLTATTINGIINTAIQPFITRVSTLNIMNHDANTTGLSLNGVLITCSADQLNSLDVNAGLASNGKALVLDDAKNIQGINSLTANRLTGLLTTPVQPNLNTVNALNIVNHNGSTGLSLAGTVVTASAQAINRIDTSIGIGAPGKALVLDTNRNISNIKQLTCEFLEGVIQTSNQPNINSVRTLNIVQHDGNNTGLALNGVLVSATAAQLNYTSVTPGTATINRSLVTNSVNSISGINTLSATKLVSEELALSGVIANFNTGGVVIKSYSFTDLAGRMIDIQLLNTLNFTRFTPADLTSGYSCEIIGYIYPQFSELYTFHATCNDRIRLWINGELILHSWIQSETSRASSAVFLSANQWIPIYIQYQVDVDSIPRFLLEWASANTIRSAIPSSRLAWDNNQPAFNAKQFTQSSMTIYNPITPTANTAKLSVDSSGDLIIDASGNDVSIGTNDNFNIPAHDGVRGGLFLGGVLVKPTAFELNYLKVSPGTTSASQALVVDASKSITGLNSVSANSISCANLSTNAFTISNLSLNGPLNNYNTGALLIRQFTGPDVNGRVVDVNTITDINLNNYDPKGLNTFYSVDILGYILPLFSESYRFHAIANDRVRIWVNNNLILNAWDSASGVEYSSDPIILTAGQWTRIYIQFQNILGTSSLQVRWSSPSIPKSFISSAYMAWDNSMTMPNTPVSSADRLTVFSSASGIVDVQSGTVSIDGNGNMSLSCKSGSISIPTDNNFNIAGHNTTTTGFRLAGSLVRASAAELNYLSGVTPGTVVASKALILDDTKSLTGMTTISATNLVGALQTGAQPNITSIGTLSSTLNTTSDIIVNSTNLLRIAADTNACYIQTGSSPTPNASSDLFIGNYNATISASTRKLMVKASGFVGIQTAFPVRTLSVNGAGSTFCTRLIHNASDGNESAFCDLGVDTSSNFRIGSNVIIGSSGTASLTVSSNGTMKITPSGGSLQIGNTTNSNLPLEIGSVPFTVSTATGFLNSEGSVGSTIPTATSYSLRTTASIIVNGSVCVTSDRRLKEDIVNLNKDKCIKFIETIQPVKFKYSADKSKSVHYGLIAQEVANTSFSNLVNVSPHDSLHSEVDDNGFVSPENAALNISYEEIIPILITTSKHAIQENKDLKNEVHYMRNKIQELENMISKLYKE